MSRSEDSDLRSQLLHAKAEISRQLEILRDPAAPAYLGWSVGGPDNRGVIAELQEELGEIDKRLAALERPSA